MADSMDPRKALYFWMEIDSVQLKGLMTVLLMASKKALMMAHYLVD